MATTPEGKRRARATPALPAALRVGYASNPEFASSSRRFSPSLFDFALTVLQMPERAQVNIKRRFSVCGGSLCCPQICDQRFLVGNYTSRFNDTLSGRHQGSVLSRHDAVRMAACGFAALGLRRFMCKVSPGRVSMAPGLVARIYAARAWRPVTAAIASAFVYGIAALLKFNLGVLE
jgi:hypothetical protein